MRFFKHFCKVIQLLSLHLGYDFAHLTSWHENLTHDTTRTQIDFVAKIKVKLAFNGEVQTSLVLNWTCECIACAFLEFCNFEIAFFLTSTKKVHAKRFLHLDNLLCFLTKCVRKGCGISCKEYYVSGEKSLQH